MNNSIRVARVMLNMLGLVLQDDEKEELEIYDREDNIVGNLIVQENGLIDIQANVNGNILSANLTSFKNYNPLLDRRHIPTSIRTAYNISWRPTMSRLSRQSFNFKFNIKNNDLSEVNGNIDFYAYITNRNICRCGFNSIMNSLDSNGKKIQISKDGIVPLLVNIEDENSFEKLYVSFDDISAKNVRKEFNPAYQCRKSLHLQR